jgi:hypothetical protein
VIVCYKEASLDPLQNTSPGLTTVQWRDTPVNQPENALLGIMFESLYDFGNSFPWVVSNASHWIYAGTGLQNGQQIPGLIGYEYDRVWNNGRTPANLQVLATSPVVDYQGVSSTHNASLYVAPSGAMVFSAGTNYFPWKVDANEYQDHVADSRAQRIVLNVLAGMTNPTSLTPVPTATHTPTRTPSPTATPPPACTPRPSVRVAAEPSGGGRLQVGVTAGAGAGISLHSIQFGAATNALIDAGSLQGSPGNATVTIPAGTTTFVFHMRRATPGQATHVPMIVYDTCGAWPTFVGGGPTAF